MDQNDVILNSRPHCSFQEGGYRRAVPPPSRRGQQRRAVSSSPALPNLDFNQKITINTPRMFVVQRRLLYVQHVARAAGAVLTTRAVPVVAAGSTIVAPATGTRVYTACIFSSGHARCLSSSSRSTVVSTLEHRMTPRTKELADQLLAGHRAGLSQAITLSITCCPTLMGVGGFPQTIAWFDTKHCARLPICSGVDKPRPPTASHLPADIRAANT